ncbi:MAG: dockerin type I repeat-containing protein, partial [Ruminococcus sp.]|nr:dockerin type I repeat-containing protein [Ruminococcus sp.]
EEYGELFARNFTVYNIQYACSNYQLPPLPTYEENYSYLKNWLNERNSWLREHYDLFSYEYLRGDADGDGIVDMLDVTTLQRALVNIKVDDDGHMALRAAMNGESIEITDATILQRYFAAMDVPFELNVKVKTYLR